MNMIINVLEEDYEKFKKKGNKIKLDNYDEMMMKYYFDVKNKCKYLKIGDAIFFYMYGYCKYYAIVTDIQLNLLTKSVRIFFEEIFENMDWKGTQLKRFYGIKYIPDIVFDPND